MLLVDDNADMRDYVRGLLAADYAVSTCVDGQEALDRLRAEPADLLITDVMMPRLDGFELVSAIRADERLNRIPVIVLSARAGEDSRVEGLAAGADAYLVKPFSARELLVTVASQLQLSRLRQEHETSLRTAARRKDEFLAVLAHELRNPLAPIRNAVEILRRSEATDENTAPLLDIMARQVGQMVRLIDDLLNVSRISRGQIELRKAPVDLADAVMQAVETARPELEQAGVELNLTLPPTAVLLDADQARLVQAIGNLLNNAAKFTQPSGRVWITAERAGRDAVIRVRDSGIGIAPEHLQAVFEMFVQLDTSLERNRSGLGLGLTIVKTLVEAHGGTVEAQSDGVGAGAQFVIRLPLPPLALPQVAGERDPATLVKAAGPGACSSSKTTATRPACLAS